MSYKDISLNDVIKIMAQQEEVFLLTRITPSTMVEELVSAAGFVIREQEEPKKNVSKIDHGKIVALYTADPPRSLQWIADDIGCSIQTVINHLKQEGVYKGKE